MRLLLTAIALALLAAAPAYAQQGDQPAPPSAEQIAAARAEADALIRAGNATEFFENITEDAVPTVRHTRSGLVCMFDPGRPGNNVHLYASAVRGDDVSCNNDTVLGRTTLYATRYPQPTSIDEQMTAAVTAIRSRMPDIRAPETPGIRMELGGATNAPALPERASATFLGTLEGQPVVTRVAVSIVNGWVIKQRVTAPGDEPMTVDLMGELTMVTTLSRIVDPNFGRARPAPAPNP